MFENAITVKPKGGLGNQLFIVAAGLASAERLNVPLIVDKSYYEVPGEKRVFELNFLDDLFVTTSNPKVSSTVFFSNLRKRARNKIFRENNAVVFDKNFMNVTPGTHLEGYFQSPLYFENVKELLIDRIVAAGTTTQLSNTIALHLRRGDYLNPTTMQFHGITSSDFAYRAIDFISRVDGNLPVLVYSDDLKIIENELNDQKYFGRKNEMSFINQQGQNNLQSLVQMSTSTHMVMSNSSFSWWAAYILSDRNNKNIVVAPRPWFADGSSAADLLIPHWLTMDARSIT